MKKLLVINVILLTLVAAFVSSVGMAPPALAATTNSTTNCTTLGVGIGSTNQVCGNGDTQLENYIGALVTWANGVIAILAVLMVMYGAVKYIYSMGNPDQIKEAKSTIIGALAGVFLLIISDVLLLAINPTLAGPLKVIFGK